MVSVVLYLHVHQPYRIGRFSFFDISTGKSYWDEHKNQDILRRVVRKSYLPTTNLLIHLMKETEGRFKVSFSITGVVLEQLNKYHPEVIDNFRKIIDLGGEVIDETYYHSLAFLYSKEEFREQVKLHREVVEELFGYSPRVFRNTELVYSNDIAKEVDRLGYEGILAEGHEKVLGWRSPTFIYTAKNSNLKVLLRHYKLSDDISFRFSLHTWDEHPLTADKFASWVNAHNGNGEVVNLFMDFETFGEHQWHETGIFDFLMHMPKEILKNPDNEFLTPSEAIRKYPSRGEIDVPFVVSWADTERDLTAWLGNSMQQYAAWSVYHLEKDIKRLNDPYLLEEWRRLQISDHFYFMCTKWFADGDVHKYFNPYDTPYEAFINYMNALEDLRHRVFELLSYKEPTREIALKFLSDVEKGKEFYFYDGSVFKNLKDLLEGLKKMKKRDFEYHVNQTKNDFADWVENSIGDKLLAQRLRECKDKKSMIGAISSRIRELKKVI